MQPRTIEGKPLVDALGLKLAEETWMEQARCVYGHAASFLGHAVLDEGGEPVMSPEEFYRLFDAAFYSRHDDRWSSGSESSALGAAVNECLRCPVRDECIRYGCADDNSARTGVIGGTTSWERQAILSDRWLPDLSHDERVGLLVSLTWAKAMGWVPLSVAVDRLRSAVAAIQRGANTDRDWRYDDEYSVVWGLSGWAVSEDATDDADAVLKVT